MHFAICIACVFLTTGCIIGKQHPAATQPATAVDARTAQPAYWMDKPAVTHVTWHDFDALWNACRDAGRARGFLIDRTDYRDGVLTTLPLVSKAAYEVWKSDVVDGHSLAQSTLNTIRRTIRFDIKPVAGGSFEATPRVLVEQFSMISRRITSVAQYRDVFSIDRVDVTRASEQYGEQTPAYYWYPIARDYALERQLAASIRQRLKT